MKKIYISENVILSESIDNSLLQLRKMLEPNKELFDHLAYGFPDMLDEYFEEKEIEVDGAYDNIDIIEEMGEKERQGFGNWVYHQWKEQSYQLSDTYYDQIPLFAVARFEGIIRNKWMLHFTNHLSSIERGGFSGGIVDYNNLAYTGRAHDMMRSEDDYGYFYAFTINDAVRYDGKKYGDEAVLFLGSGVKIYHYGDKEPQVIFNGALVQIKIPIYQDEGGWTIYDNKTGKILRESDKIEEVAYWAIENLAQYRKRITF